MLHFSAAYWRKLLAVVLAATLDFTRVNAEEEVWTGANGGWWSDDANWADGTAPGPGGSAALALRFTAPSATNATSIHDLNDEFLINLLVFEPAAGESLTLSSLGTKRLALSGPQSRIIQSGPGEVTITAPLALNSSNLVTTFDAAGDLRIEGGITGADAVVKAGTGTLTISAPATFSGDLFVRGGTFALKGDGTVQSASISVESGAKLSLDATASASARLPANQSLTLRGGELSITGDTSAASMAKVGALSAVGAGNTLRLASTQPLTFEFSSRNIGSGEVLVRARRLGGASGTAFTRVISDYPLTGPAGLSSMMYSASGDGPGGERFTIYNSARDAAGVIGLQPLRESALTPASKIKNTVIPRNADVLVQGAARTRGERAKVRTLTFEPGASLTQSAAQTLKVAGSRVLVRSGGAPVEVNGGTIEFGEFGVVTAFGDLVLNAAVAGPQPWVKLGPGLLTLGAQPADGPLIRIGSGPFRPLTADALAANTISMDGEGATLDMGGNSASIGALDYKGTIRFGGATLTLGTARSDFQFRGSFADDGELVIADGGDPRARRSLERLSGPGQPGITLASGRLSYADRLEDAPLPLTLSGGVLEAVSSRVPLIVAGDAVIHANGVLSATPAAISGPGNLRIEPSGGFSIVTPDTHTGTTTIHGGGLFLEGVNGMLSGTSSIRVENGSLTVLYGPSSAGRLNDTTPVHLSGGILAATGPTDGTVVEEIGTLHAGARSGIDLGISARLPASSSVVELRMPRLERSEGGVLEINATRLVERTELKHVSIYVADPPAMIGGGASAGADTSIVPWIVGYEGDHFTPGAFTLVTYDASRGFRALDSAADFAQGFAAVTASTNNVRVSGLETLSAPVEVNALMLSDHLAPPRLEGAAPITVTSGLVLSNSASTSTIAVPLEFRSVEGILHVERGDAVISGEISGSGGLTKTSRRTATLTGLNSFTGGLRILEGTLRFMSDGALGAAPSAIDLNGGTLAYAGSGPAVLNRAISLHGDAGRGSIVSVPVARAGGGTFSSESADALFTVAGPISGPGGLTVRGGNVLLTGANSYSGDTTIAQGSLRFTSDAALGSGSLHLAGGLLEPLSDWTTSRDVNLTSLFPAPVSTGSFDVRWRGELVGDGTLSKRGAGRLTLEKTNHFSGRIEVSEGTVELHHAAPRDPFSIRDISVSAGATLAGTGWWGSSLSSRGRVEPGPGIGEIRASSMTFIGAPGDNATLALEIASPVSFDHASSDYGFSLIGKPELAIDLAYDPADDADSFLIVSIGVGSASGHFYSAGRELQEGSVFAVGTQRMRLSYAGGDGNDLVLYAVSPRRGVASAAGALSGEGIDPAFDPVPEPGGAACLLSALLWFGALRRARLRCGSR